MVAALQILEAGAAGFLVWIAIHVPTVAGVLVSAAVVLVGWAALADGPFGIVHLVGLGLHRRGLLVIGAGIAGLPVASGRVTDSVVVIPCLLVAVLLIRTGLVRWSIPPDTVDSPVHEWAGPAGNTLPHGARDAIRRAGRVTGRAGTVVARKADVAVPNGARAAGKMVGRLRSAPKR